jgi:hypothetical protein
MCSHDQFTSSKVKFDAELLLRYVFDAPSSDMANVIKICRVNVKKTGGAVLSHYYAQLFLSNNFMFEFHPGSQPKTFQTIDYEREFLPHKTLVLCDDCCKQELRRYIDGENRFNIAFHNCEAILCNRKSVQTTLTTILLFVLIANIIQFNYVNLLLIVFILFLLYIGNNYLLMEPKVEYCKHYEVRKK